MSDKDSVLQAMRKMKKANRDVEETTGHGKVSGSKSARSDSGKKNIAENIVNAVSNLKNRD